MKTACKTVYEFFKKHRDKWTQGEMAKDEKGMPCSTDDENACCFCLAGAIDLIYGVSGKCEEADNRVTATLQNKYNYYRHFVTWNDMPKRTVEEVIQLAKEAGV